MRAAGVVAEAVERLERLREEDTILQNVRKKTDD